MRRHALIVLVGLMVLVLGLLSFADRKGAGNKETDGSERVYHVIEANSSAETGAPSH